LVVLLGVFAAWGLVGDVPGASAGPVPHIGPLSLTLEAAPTNGSAPLLVAFQASVVPAVPSSFQWSFGDGTGWTSSGSNSSSVTHLYAAYGLFTARVSVTQGRNSANATVLIGVSGVPLTASASAVLTSGFAPLTVNFSGRPHGGSGTYTALLWNFGDGDQGTGPNVQYTYLRPGSYRAELTVTDSVNRSAYANLSINVSMAAVPTPTESPTSSGSWDYLLGLTVAVMGVVAFAWSRRARPQAVPPAGSEEGGPLSVEFDPIVDDLGSGAAPEPSLVTSESPFVPPGPDPLETPGPSPEALAIRVLLHLYGLGRLDPDELATPPWTQAGVAEHLGIRQNAASRVLRRLEAGGVVESRTRHVRGQSRRVKVYTLTSSGERLARDLRLTRASAGSPIPGSEFSPRETDW
jgi:DNA-binding MarR family transcriptional regulator